MALAPGTAFGTPMAVFDPRRRVMVDPRTGQPVQTAPRTIAPQPQPQPQPTQPMDPNNPILQGIAKTAMMIPGAAPMLLPFISPQTGPVDSAGGESHGHAALRNIFGAPAEAMRGIAQGAAAGINDARSWAFDPAQAPVAQSKPAAAIDIFGPSPGGQQIAGPGAALADSPYNVVVGNGRYGSPPKPLTNSSIGEVIAFGRNVLIPNTKAAGIGRDSRGLLGSSASGAYQFTSETLQRLGPKVLGDQWRQTPFTPQVQDRLAEALFNESKNGNLKSVWASLPDATPGAYANVPWSQMKSLIMQGESGGGAGGGGFMNPYSGGPAEAFDTAGFNRMGQAFDALMTPSQTITDAPRTMLPELQPFANRDFSASDAALEKLRPAEILEQDKQKMVRQGIFAGMARALAATPDGAGLGKVMAMLGSGILGGNVEGNDEIQRRMDKYDEMMSKYNTAIFNNEQDKSQSIYETMKLNVNQDNQRIFDQWRQDTKDNQTTITPEGLVLTMRRDGDKMVTNTAPIVPMIQAKRAMAESGYMADIAGRHMGGANVVAGAQNALLQQAAMAAASSGDPANRELGKVGMLYDAMQNGTLYSALGAESVASAQQAFMKQIGPALSFMSQDQVKEQWENFLISNAARSIQGGDTALLDALESNAQLSQTMTQARRVAGTRTNVNAKGQTTYSIPGQ